MAQEPPSEGLAWKFTVGDLRTALAPLMRVIPAKTSVTALQYVRFMVDERGHACLEGRSGEVAARIPLPWQALGPRGLALAAKPLNELLRLLDPAQVMTLTPVPGHLATTVEVGTLKYQTLAWENDPDAWVPPVPEVPGLECSWEALWGPLRTLRPFISPDSHRQVLTGVVMQVDADGEATFIATDTHRLGTLRRADYIVGGAVEYRFSDVLLKLLAALRVEDETGVNVVLDGGRVGMKVGDVTISAAYLAGTYPNWRRVVPGMEGGPVAVGPVYTFDGPALARVVRRVAVVARDNAYRVRLRLHDDGIDVSGRSEEIGEILETTPWAKRAFEGKETTHEMEIAFNLKYMLDMAAALGPEFTGQGSGGGSTPQTATMPPPSRPFKFSSMDGKTCVTIMPMALA